MRHAFKEAELQGFHEEQGKRVGNDGTFFWAETVTTPLINLVLMDIRIQGPQDGIEVAGRLHAEFEVPVSYLTACADAPILERAKATMPYGYIMKP